LKLGEKILLTVWMALGFGFKLSGLIYAVVVSLSR
jgi:hypothetical protein